MDPLLTQLVVLMIILTNPGVIIQLTGLESMWYNHEENVNHPSCPEYPVNINVPFMKLMRQRVVDSILHRTGIHIRTFDNVIHASISFW